MIRSRAHRRQQHQQPWASLLQLHNYGNVLQQQRRRTAPFWRRYHYCEFCAGSKRQYSSSSSFPVSLYSKRKHPFQHPNRQQQLQPKCFISTNPTKRPPESPVTSTASSSSSSSPPSTRMTYKTMLQNDDDNDTDETNPVDQGTTAPMAVPLWKKSMEQLEERSRLAIASDDTLVVEDLIDRWSQLLPIINLHSKEALVAATERMHDLYRTWQSSSAAGASSLSSQNTAQPYRQVLHAFCYYHIHGPRALALLQAWEDQLGGNMELAPRESDYNAVLHAYANMENDNGIPEETTDVALEVISHLESSYLVVDHTLPDLTSYRNAIRCVARTIERLATSADTSQQNSHSNNDSHKAIKTRFQELESLMEKFQQKIIPGSPSEKQFSATVSSLSDALISLSSLQRSQYFARQAGKIFDQENTVKLRAEWIAEWLGLVNVTNAQLWERYQEHGTNYCVAVLERTTHAILQLYQRDMFSQSNLENADATIACAEGMTHIVLQLDDMVSVMDVKPLLPSGRHFKLAVQAWGHCRKHCPPEYEVLARQQSDLLLDRMLDLHGQVSSQFAGQWATDSWNDLLQAYLDMGDPDKVKKLWDENKNQDPNGGQIRRNQRTHIIYFQSLAAKRQNDAPWKARRRAEMAHALWKKLTSRDPSTLKFELTAEMYASVMWAWCRSYHNDAAPHCQDVFDRLVVEAQTNPKMSPTETHYRALLTTWGYSRLPNAFQNLLGVYEQMRCVGVNFDLPCMASVLFALSRSGTVEGASKAEELLMEMRMSAERSSDAPRPTTACFNSVMYAWCHSGTQRVMERNEIIFDQLEADYANSGYDPTLRPDSSSYAMLIQSLLASNSNNAVERAESILAKMEADAAQSHCTRPDTKVYTEVMKVHWKCGDPKNAASKVENAMRRMKQAYRDGNHAARPDVHAMTILLHAWAVSDDPCKASKTWSIIEEMRVEYENGNPQMQPTPYSYSAVLNACAFTKTKNRETRARAVKVAFMAITELDRISKNLGEPVFRNMFQVLVRQVDDLAERTKLAEVIFQKCCQEGLVNSWIVKLLKDNVPSIYKKLQRNHGKIHIPENWSRRVKKK